MKALILAALLIHSWYPQSCCSDRDCRRVPCTTITTHPDGSIDWTDMHFDSSLVHVSKDGDCHVCVGYNEMATPALRWPVCAFIAMST